jgi:hypothetical protein
MFKIDVRERVIRFGDALGGMYAPSDLARLQRFLDRTVPGLPPYRSGPPLQMNRQLDSYSCAITTWDLICEEVFEGDPWTDEEKHVRRVEYALLLCLGSKIVTAEDLGLPVSALLDMKSARNVREDKSMSQVIARSPSAMSSDLYDDQPPYSSLPSSPSSRVSVLDDDDASVMDVTEQEMTMKEGEEDRDKDDVPTSNTRLVDPQHHALLAY